MSATAMSVMERLKAETAELHSAAERHPFQRRLLKGELDRGEYGAWLGQMLLVHRALEGKLRGAVKADARIAAVVKEEQYQERYLLEDLAYLGIDAGAVSAMPGTARLVGEIGHAGGVALLGMHYVLEGSNNGSRYIAIAVRRSLGLETGKGDRYLDPYGEFQRGKWAEFRREVDSREWTEAEAAAMIEAAKRMFLGISWVSEDLEGRGDQNR